MNSFNKFPQLFLLGFCFISSAHFCLAADLLDVYKDALANDYSYQEQILNEQAELKNFEIAKSGLKPRINFLSNWAEFDSDDSGLNGSDSQYGLEFRQLVYDRALLSSYRSAKISAQISNLAIDDVHQELIERVAEAYFGVLQARDVLALAINNLDAANTQSEEVEKRLKHGLATEVQYQQSVSRAGSSYTAKLRAEDSVRSAVRQLHEITSVRYQSLSQLAKTRETNRPTTDYNPGWAELALKSNLDILRANLSVQVAKENVQLSKAGYSPRVDFSVDYLKTNSSTGFDFTNQIGRSEQLTARLQLRVPIWQGGQASSEVGRAKKLLSAAEKNLEFLNASTLNEATGLLDRLKTLELSVKALSKATTSAQVVFNARQKGFKYGLETNLTVLDAQRDLFEISLESNQVKYDLILLGLAMERIAGELDVSDLEWVNSNLLVTGE